MILRSTSVLRARLRALAGALGCLALLWLTTGSPARATIMREMSIDELTRVSTHVVRGTVLGQVARWTDDHKGILTYIDVALNERLKDSPPLPNVVQIVEPGGELDGVRMKIVGGPVFKEGEDLFLFLGDYSDDPAEKDMVVLNGGKMGRMPVVTDSSTGKVSVVREYTDVEFARFVQDDGRPHMEISPGPPDRKIPIADFRRMVLDAVRAASGSARGGRK